MAKRHALSRVADTDMDLSRNRSAKGTAHRFLPLHVKRKRVAPVPTVDLDDVVDEFLARPAPCFTFLAAFGFGSAPIAVPAGIMEECAVSLSESVCPGKSG